MISSNRISVPKRSLASRSVEAAASDLRQALAAARSSPTLQEGLYRAYRTRLCDLETALRHLPHGLQAAIRELVADLRAAFGFDERTGTKVGASTLGQRHAELLLARLEAIASNAEAMTAAEEPAPLW